MSLRFMLDTDTVSFALRGQGGVAGKLLEHRPSDLCISAITLGELEYGIAARRSRKLRALVNAFTQSVATAPFDARAAGQFGTVATALKRSGTPIGQFDTLIAAHALSLGLTLVTSNVQHFRVSGLAIENWA